MKVFVAAIAAGFPIALIVAWAFEMTPKGSSEPKTIPSDEHLPHWSKRKFAASDYQRGRYRGRAVPP